MKTVVVCHLLEARDALLFAQRHMEAVRALGVSADGDFNDLLFAPVLKASPDRQAPPLAMWLERVGRFIKAAEAEADAAHQEALDAATAAEASPVASEEPKAAEPELPNEAAPATDQDDGA